MHPSYIPLSVLWKCWCHAIITVFYMYIFQAFIQFTPSPNVLFVELHKGWKLWITFLHILLLHFYAFALYVFWNWLNCCHVTGFSNNLHSLNIKIQNIMRYNWVLNIVVICVSQNGHLLKYKYSIWSVAKWNKATYIVVT